jgi:RHS repeat-associated protein
MSLQNETKILHSYNSRNQLIKTTEGDAVKDYSYDKRGNLTSIIENGMTTSSFVFNSANRMVEAITSKGKAEYEYNGFLKRVSKLETLQCNSTEIKDPLQKVKYTLDLTKPYNDLLSIGEQRFVWGNELLQSEGSNNNEQFSYLNDHLGSPIRLVGNSQTETLSYDEFGVPLIDASTNISTNQSKHLNNANHFHNPFGFTGYQSDNISNLYYAQARYYYPSVGRFGATDVIKGYDIWPATLNEYSYCVNNPNIYIDPDGELLISALVVGIVIGVIVGGTIGGVNAYQNNENVVVGIAGGAIVGGAIGAVGAIAAPAGAVVAGTATGVAGFVGGSLNHIGQGLYNHGEIPSVGETLKAGAITGLLAVPGGILGGAVVTTATAAGVSNLVLNFAAGSVQWCSELLFGLVGSTIVNGLMSQGSQTQNFTEQNKQSSCD